MNQLNKSVITKTLLSVILAGTGIIAVSAKSEADTFQVRESGYGTTADVGTLAWAINQANTTSGLDTISITAGLQINVDAASALPGTNTFLARFTESVDVLGNGAKLVGNPTYITTGGQVATKTNIVSSRYDPAIIPGDVITTPGFNFAQIGTPSSDNSSISVNMSNLSADGLATFVQANEGSRLTMIGGGFDNMVNYTDVNAAGRSVFQANSGSTLNLSDVSITNSSPFQGTVDASTDYSIFFGVIQGEDSTLNLENSSINDSFGAGAIAWNGGTANVVSSIFNDSGGLSIADGTTEEGVLNLVNSIVYMTGGDDLSQTQRIQAAVGGEANIIASSVLYEASNTSSTGCGTVSYLCSGMPLTATQGGLLNFNSSVALPLNAEFFFPGKDSYSEFSFGNLVAGDYSYIAATQAQDADAVRALFGNLSILTEGLVYDLVETGIPEFPFLFGQLPNGAVPLVDGVLVSVIPDATPGGANQLMNPIDGSPITADVFGNPRTNVLGFRDIGAVQVLGAGDECWEEETAWSDGDRYLGAKNWATYTTYECAYLEVTLFAGRDMDAGTVIFSDPVNGIVTITIELNDGWRFLDDDENLKIQGYDAPPMGNPSPGKFDNKFYAVGGDSFSVDVPVDCKDGTYCYGVHVDVEWSYDCNDDGDD